jgi:hypothetical protein
MRVRNAGDLEDSGMAPLELGEDGFFHGTWKSFDRERITQLHRTTFR